MLSLLQKDLFDYSIKYDVYNFDDEENDEATYITIAISKLVWKDLIEKEDDKIERLSKLCKDILINKSLSFDNRLRALMLHFTTELNIYKGDGIIVSNTGAVSESEE